MESLPYFVQGRYFVFSRPHAHLSYGELVGVDPVDVNQLAHPPPTGAQALRHLRRDVWGWGSGWMGNRYLYIHISHNIKIC